MDRDAVDMRRVGLIAKSPTFHLAVVVIKKDNLIGLGKNGISTARGCKHVMQIKRRIRDWYCMESTITYSPKRPTSIRLNTPQQAIGNGR